MADTAKEETGNGRIPQEKGEAGEVYYRITNGRRDKRYTMDTEGEDGSLTTTDRDRIEHERTVAMISLLDSVIFEEKTKDDDGKQPLEGRQRQEGIREPRQSSHNENNREEGWKIEEGTKTFGGVNWIRWCEEMEARKMDGDVMVTLGEAVAKGDVELIGEVIRKDLMAAGREMARIGRTDSERQEYV